MLFQPRRIASAAWLTLAVSSACGGTEAPPTSQAPSDTPVAPTAVATAPEALTVSPESLPFDLDEVLATAALQYVQKGARYEASPQRYHVEASGGIVRFWSRPAGDAGANASTPFSLETVAIERLDGELDRGTGAMRASLDASLKIDRGVAEEQLVNQRDAVQQAWIFAHEPAGVGPMAVRVAVRGALRYLGDIAGKHYFLDEATGLGVSYTDAKWIDFDGVETEIPVRFDTESSELRIEIPADVLARSAYPAVLDPIIGAEVLVSPDTTGSGAQAALTEYPAVASDGTNYFVVWADQRDRATMDIWGALVSSAGAVLNPRGVPIAIATVGNQTRPSVAFSAGQYLVAWEDGRDGAAASDVIARFVDTSGNVIGSEMVISNSDGAFAPDVAAFNGDWMVAWEERTGGNSSIRYRTVDAMGVLGAVVTPNALLTAHEPALACSPTQCLLAFHAGASNNEDVSVQRVDGTAAIDVLQVSVSGSSNGRQLGPDVAFDGTRFLVVWQDLRNGNSFDIFGNFVDATGARSSASGTAISASPSNQRAPALAWAGTQYLVSWQDSRSDAAYDIFGVRVAADGTLSSAAGTTINNRSKAQTFPAVAALGSDWLAVWMDGQNGANNVRGTVFSSAGVVSNADGTVVSRSGARHTAPVIGWAQSISAYVIAYSSNRSLGSEGFDVSFMRVNPNGTLIGVAGSDLTGVVPGSQFGPEMAFNGTDFLVVWSDARSGGFDIYGDRFTALGTISNFVTITTAAGDQRNPAVVWNAGTSEWLVAYQDTRSGANSDIYGNLVSATGTVSADLPLLDSASEQIRPTLATDGADYLLAAVEYTPSVANSENIRGVIVSGAGTPGASFEISAAAGKQEHPDAHWNGSNYVVVWQDARGATSDIFGGRITPVGALLDGDGVQLAGSATLGEYRPRAISVGSGRELLAYSRQESVGSPWWDLYGQEFTTGLALTGAEFAISTVANSSEDEVTLAFRTPTSQAVAYQRYDSDSSRRSERVFVRTLDDSSVGCADGEREGFTNLATHPDIAACAGGFQVGGVVSSATACQRGAGDDFSIPSGAGCRADDLCSAGWHVCDSQTEVAAKSPTGCGGVTGGFFASRQSSGGSGNCATPGTNDVFGCGDFGATSPIVNCGPFNRFTMNNCSGLAGSQWVCSGETLEATNITHGDSLQGGVLCCRD